MKSLFLILISLVSALGVENYTLLAQPVNGGGDSATLTLATGDTASLTYASFMPSGLFSASAVRLVVTSGKAGFELPTSIVASENVSGTAYTLNKIHLAGPATLKLRVGSVTTTPDAHGVMKKPELATIEVTRYGTPSDGIPLPPGSSLWTVFLETSTDLVTWSSVPSGNYASDTPTRFFRTRIIQR